MPNLCQNLQVVLVVEDEALVRGCVVMQLEDAGYGVVEAADAEEGLREFNAREDITTVFTDVNMPGPFDGLALVRKIFQRRPGVQLILTSGRDAPSSSAIPAGVHFLPKPYEWNSLARLLSAA